MALPAVVITGKVLTPGGDPPVSGYLEIRLSQAGSVSDGADSQRVGAMTRAVLGTDGALPAGFDLVPNDAIVPSGTYYRVKVSLDTGVGRVTWEEKWQLASAPSPLDIGEVPRLDVVPGVAVAPVSLSGDLGGTYLAPEVRATHLTAPLPQAQGGTGAASLTAAGAVAVAGDLGGTAASPQVTATHLGAPLPQAQGGTGAATLGAGTVTATGSTTPRSLADLASYADIGPSRLGPLGSPWRLRATLTQIAKMTTAPPAQLRVMRGGDSVSQHIADRTMTRLMTALGSAGFVSVLGSSNYTSLWQVTAGDAIARSHHYNFTKFATGGYVDLGPGGTVRLGSGGAGVYCDEIKLLYTVEPGAGTFQVETETGGVYTVQTASQSAAGAATTGVLTYSLPYAQYSLRVTGLTGRVALTGISMRTSTVSGVVEIHFTAGGWQLANTLDGVSMTPGIVDTPDAIMNAWMAAVAPDLFMWESKEFATVFEQQWDRVLAWAQAGNPLIDLIGIGSTPTGNNDADQVRGNIAIRTKVTARGGIYWDAHVPQVDYATAVAYGWMDGVDLVHQTTLGHEVQSALFWHEMFAGIGNLPEPRKVQTDRVGVRQLGVKATASSASDTATFTGGTYDATIALTRKLLLESKSTPGVPFASLAPTADANGYTANTLPIFRTQGRKFDGTRIDGPWLRADPGGTIIMSAPDGGNNQNLAPFGASVVHVGTLGAARLFAGAGSPEGVVTATVGGLYLRTDGAAGSALYVKEVGAGPTGWVAK